MPPRLSNHQMRQICKTLQIMQVNVGRGGAANDLALAIAFEEDIDILLIQEPWIGADLERKLAKRHKSYEAYAPGEAWKERPRVITYVRRQTPLWSVEKCQDILRVSNEMPEILVLELKPDSNEESIFFVNVYNAPAGSERAGKSAEVLMNVSVTPPTQGTWRSDDYVNALRLVDGCLSMERVVELFIYILGGRHKRARPRLPSQSRHHKSNITFPNNILSTSRQAFFSPLVSSSTW